MENWRSEAETASIANKKIRLSLHGSLFCLGWKMGFEPTTFGTTIRRSNQLNYIHRFRNAKVSPIFLFTKFYFYFLPLPLNCYLYAVQKKMNQEE